MTNTIDCHEHAIIGPIKIFSFERFLCFVGDRLTKTSVSISTQKVIERTYKSSSERWSKFRLGDMLALYASETLSLFMVGACPRRVAESCTSPSSSDPRMTFKSCDSCSMLRGFRCGRMVGMEAGGVRPGI